MTTLSIAGLTFDGGDAPGVDVLEELDGWFDGTDVEAEVARRPGAHGAFALPAYSRGRTVAAIVSRRCSSDAEAGAARRTFAALLADGGYAELTVVEPDGHKTSALVRRASRPLVKWFPYSQMVRAQVEFYAPDPLRYSEAITKTTGFALSAGGLEFPLFTDGTADTGFLEFGAQGSTGRISLGTQPGTAPGHTQFVVMGPVPSFSIVRVETGRRLTFADPVLAGSTLVIDGASGSALLNGGEVDYSGRVTRSELEPVRPGEPVTFAFQPEGPYSTGTLTVTHRAAWW